MELRILALFTNLKKMHLKIFIVEDERIVAATLAAMVEDMGHEVVTITHDLASAREGLRTTDFDVAILDINLKLGEEGIQLGEELLERNIPFFFVTSYSDMNTVESAKRVRPGAYVVKPFTEQDLFVALEMTMMRAHDGTEEGITVRQGNAHARIPFVDIAYLKAENIYVELYTKDKVWLKRSTLKDLMDKMGPSTFVQTHRSFAVNTRFVASFNKNEVKVGNASIPVSKSHRELVLRALSGD